MEPTKATLRTLPSVEHMLQTPAAQNWTAVYGRPLTIEAIRATLEDARKQFRETSQVPDQEAISRSVQALLETWTSPTLVPVINATGVILHTNLGRAPLSQEALKAVLSAGLGYTNLEYDLEKGQRGSRLSHAEAILSQLTGAEAALVVNNNAAAVLLALTALARRKDVVISRTQLVEIGGGFRVPDVMKQSGARLVEVGATNRVHLSDYQQAIDEGASLVLWAHRSNFRLTGFTSEPSLSDLADLAHRAGLLLIDDLGSGALLDTALFGLGHEPTVQESLAAGADLVCFSGDKLLGGPQAGIIIGRAELVAKLKKHPLARALRADKLCLAALSATLLHYLKDEAVGKVPIWKMISMPADRNQARVNEWIQQLGMGSIVQGQSTVGGGSLPEENLQTFLLALEVRSPNRFLARIRQGNPAIIARLEDDRVVFDPRTVLEEQESLLLKGIRTAYERK